MGLRVLALIVLATSMARAGDAKVDWGKGLVTADGVGVADRHAPNPAVARGTSRRTAETAAKQVLAAAVRALPLAGGGTVGERAKDAAVAARLDRAVEQAIGVDAAPETDGAWHVTMAVPIEAVRQSVDGPRALPADGDKGPAVIVIDGVTAAPAVGWKIGAVAAATTWVTEVPAWAKDAPKASAKGAKAGVIAVDGITGTAATLFVIVGKR